jgi:hypothetical protein
MIRISILSLCAVLLAGCVMETEDENLEEVQQAISYTYITQSALDTALRRANGGTYVNGRYVAQGSCTYEWMCYADEWDWWNTPFVSCTSSYWSDTCVGPNGNILYNCNWSRYNKDYYAGYTFGACNSSAWGQIFSGYLNYSGGLAPFTDRNDSRMKASGFTLSGHHPYYCVKGKDGVIRTYHGHSTSNLCSTNGYSRLYIVQ